MIAQPASAKQSYQPKKLLKLPKEMPSNIVSLFLWQLFLQLLIHLTYFGRFLTDHKGRDGRGSECALSNELNGADRHNSSSSLV